jgi:hypothetical protein
MRPITIAGIIAVIIVAGIIIYLSGVMTPAVQAPVSTPEPIAPTPAPTPMPVVTPAFVPTPHFEESISSPTPAPTPEPTVTPRPTPPPTPTPGPLGTIIVTTNVTNGNGAGITVYDAMYWSLPVASMWGTLDYNFTLPYGDYVVLLENPVHIIINRSNVTLNQPVVHVTLEG